MTDLLLDTNVIIWYFCSDARITPSIHKHMEEAAAIYASAVSVWEFFVKKAAGKLTAPDNLLEMIAAKRFLELPVTFKHARCGAQLPPIHKDPFDRLLVAQALCEGLTVMTADRHIPLYGAKVIAV